MFHDFPAIFNAKIVTKLITPSTSITVKNTSITFSEQNNNMLSKKYLYNWKTYPNYMSTKY